MNTLIIDNRMRDIEKDTLKKLGYQLVETNTNKRIYPEVSSHPDIFFTKIKNFLIVDDSQYQIMENNPDNTIKIIKGDSVLYQKYPYDISYNVCILGNYAIHNFKYTDRKIIEILKKEQYSLINVKQGYTKCSIAIVDENSIIISDKGLYEKLKKYNINILFLDYKPDIKLLNNNNISPMNGFIGGAISRIGNNIFISGDLRKIDRNNLIKDYIQERDLNLISLENLEVIDYGGIIEI